MLARMVEKKGIEPHVPVWEKGECDDGTFPRSAVAFDAAADTLTCPAGKTLRQYSRNFTTPLSGVIKADQRIYRAAKADCGSCALKERCRPGQPMRKVIRSVHESSRETARQVHGTPAYGQSKRDRKKVEMLLATSSASSNLIACGCADDPAPATGSTSLQPPRTSARWRRFSSRYPRWRPHDRGLAPHADAG